jgi:hypothetical protein
MSAVLNLSLRLWYLVFDRLSRLSVPVDELGGALRAIAAGQGESARRFSIEQIAAFEREVRAVL